MVFPMNQTEQSNDINPSVKALTEMLFNTPLSNDTKIQFLREELLAGRYNIESQSLAKKLIEHHHPEPLQVVEEIF